MINTIYYKDGKHKDTLKELLIKYKKVYEKYNNEVDQYYLPAFYIFTADEELRRKCLPYITSDGILFNKMETEQDFSSGPSVLIKLAHQLYNEGDKADIMDIIGILDKENFKVALQVIELRKYGCKYEEL